MRRGWLVVVVLALTACGPGGAQRPVDQTLHSIASCAASAVVPDDVSTVTPSSTSPPTAILKTGQAVAFPAPAGSRVRAVGSSDRPTDSVLCQSARGSGADRQTVLLGLAPGFVRVAVIAAGSTTRRTTLVTVTG